jgi:signal transduction histidine kinase
MIDANQATYVLPPLIVVLVGLALVAVVFSWAPATRSRSYFVGMLAGLIFWGLFVLGMRLSDTPETALSWNRWTPVTVYLMFLFFYLFSREYTHLRGQGRFVLSCFGVLAAALIAAPLGLLIEDLRVEPYGYAPVLGALAVPLGAAGLVVFVAALSTLIRRYRVSTSEEERNRLAYLIAASCFPLVGALLDISTNLPPVGIWGNLVFCVACSVALLEYRLLDIPQVARRTLTYLVLGFMVAVPYVLTLLALQRIFGARLESFWSYLFTVLFLALFLRPLYSAAQDLVDRAFFRDRYDALRALEQFGREAQHEVDLDVLCCHLTRLVTSALHANRTYLFLPSGGSGDLHLVSCDGVEPLPREGSFSRRGALVRWMLEHPEILAHRMLDIEPQLQALSFKERQTLESIGAHVLVPVTSAKGLLSGLLILGEKRSERAYSGEDRRLLEALGRQMAISLDNARLFNDAVRARRNLEQWLDGMDDSVIIVDQNRTIRFLNRSAQQHLGVSLNDPCWATLGEEMRCDRCALLDAWSGENGSIRLTRRIGDREYEVIAAALQDPDGERSLISVLRDVTEQRLVEEELRRSREQLRELALHQESVREDERTGIARELHDELGQLLTALKMDLVWLGGHLTGVSVERAQLKLCEMVELTETSVSAVQRMSSQLRPGVLDDLGLAAALEWLARDFQQRSGVQCALRIDESIHCEGHHATVLFRICQESLTNVARHAHATSVDVSLTRRGLTAVLTVSDNGRGITSGEMEHPRSFGVIGMRERARALGGSVALRGAPGEGTTVEVKLPLEESTVPADERPEGGPPGRTHGA